jgi:hypothetical protein
VPAPNWGVCPARPPPAHPRRGGGAAGSTVYVSRGRANGGHRGKPEALYECIYSKGDGFPHFFVVAVYKEEAGDEILERHF